MRRTKPVNLSRRRFNASLAAFSLTAAGGFLPATARAQAYPTKPVTIILPFGPGGVADVTTRLAAERLSQKLGHRFVVENRPGAFGAVAARAVIGATPDGYTLGLVSNGTAISAALAKALPFDPVKQFEMITLMGIFELVMIVAAEAPYKTLQDFIAAAKAQPGKLNVGTITVGSTQNLTAELLKISAGIDFQIIPHKSTGDATASLLRNDVQLVVEFPAGVRGMIADKRARAIATTGAKRSVAAELSEVPTVQEQGIADFDVVSWNGFFGPPGLPRNVIDTINKAMHEIVAEPDIRKRYLDLGVQAQASTPEELHLRLVNDIKRWTTVIERAGIPKQ
jgi:tripartite-type tricarboxylate transporter receptor subunit TctC